MQAHGRCPAVLIEGSVSSICRPGIARPSVPAPRPVGRVGRRIGERMAMRPVDRLCSALGPVLIVADMRSTLKMVLMELLCRR